jgi:putative ABC transport system substrate-binding protein
VVANLSHVAVLYTANPATALSRRNLEEAASAAGIGLQIHEVSAPDDFEDAFDRILEGRADALYELASPLAFAHRVRVAELALGRRIPAMFGRPEFVAAGGLMSYGTSPAEMTRRAAVYADKILRGTRPADLPIEQPTRFDLVVNLKTAQALGLTISPSVLAQATETIQ